jgi:flagella basal body P-ring formation protein FlgA
MTGGGVRLEGWWAGMTLASVLSMAPLALAGQPVALKADISSGASVTLGDIFNGAGGQASVVIGNGAPAGQRAVLDASAVRELARRHGLDWDNPDRLARIVVTRAGDSMAAGRLSEALTWAHSVAAGDLIQPEDLTYAKVASFAVPADAPRDADQIIGKVARRPLRGGAAVATRDVAAPQVIKAGDTVAVAYRAGGVSLVLQGKAIGSAAVGDAVEIMNPVSKKLIHAVAAGTGEAVVGPAGDTYRARPDPSAAHLAALR